MHFIVSETNRNCVCSAFEEITWEESDPNDRVAWSVICRTVGRTSVERWCVQGGAEGMLSGSNCCLFTVGA